MNGLWPSLSLFAGVDGCAEAWEMPRDDDTADRVYRFFWGGKSLEKSPNFGSVSYKKLVLKLPKWHFLLDLAVNVQI